MNYIQMKNIEKKLNGYISKSKKAYERNDSKAEIKWADMLKRKLRN